LDAIMIDPTSQVVIRRFDVARDARVLREWLVDQQNFHRRIEPSWPDGEAFWVAQDRWPSTNARRVTAVVR
jgi:hypothetical protein